MASAGQTPPFKTPDSMRDKYTRHTIVQVLVLLNEILLTESYKNKVFWFFFVKHWLWIYLDMSSCLEAERNLLDRYRNKTQGCFHSQESTRGSRGHIRSHLRETHTRARGF